MTGKTLERMALPLIWLAVCAVLVFVSRNQIALGLGWGPDDLLRQVQIRDWLAGQSWFDTTQYRIGEPTSAPMHWPRWVSLPLAALIVALTPLLGAAMAETVAMVVVPLILLGLAMLLVARISETLFDRRIALLAAALTATAVPLVAQLRPMRIDHHGWQVVLALFALWTLFWADRRKGGIALGAAMALWLSISLEGLPLSIAFVALLGWRWLVEKHEGVRLFWTLAAFAVASLLLYLAVQGGFGANYCDAMAPVHLLAIGVGSAIMLPAIQFQPPAVWQRLLALALAGGAALGVILTVAPQCAGAAFAIDPLVRDYWFDNVPEGLPVWRQPVKASVVLFGGSIIIGLVALLVMAWRRFVGIDRQKLFLLAYAFLWALLVAIFVQRAAATAAAFALPLMAWLVHQAFLRARQIDSSVIRIFATAAVVFLILPGPLAVSAYNAVTVEPDKDVPTSDGPANAKCESHAAIAKLTALPDSMLIAPFDIGPEILAVTSHRVLATSHHRNDTAMADQIRIYTAPPAEARKRLADRHIRYLIACPDEAEMEIYAKRAPTGLWAQIADDKVPDWMNRVHFKGSDMMVWRIAPLPETQ